MKYSNQLHIFRRLIEPIHIKHTRTQRCQFHGSKMNDMAANCNNIDIGMLKCQYALYLLIQWIFECLCKCYDTLLIPIYFGLYQY